MNSYQLLAVAILVLLNAGMFIRVFDRTHSKGNSFHDVWEAILVEDQEGILGRLAMRIVYVFISIISLISLFIHTLHK